MAKKEKLNKLNLQSKQEDTGTQKVLSFLTKLFIGEKGVEKQINRSIVSNTYFFFLEVVHHCVLFGIFMGSNSVSYSVIQSAIGIYFTLVYLIPRISKKHAIFQITFILYSLGTIGAGLALILLFKNFSIFSFYCSDIQKFYAKKSITQYLSKSICENVYNMYITELIIQMLFLGMRFLYLFWCFRAYMVARETYDQEEKKKRRKDRYNELLLKRTTYNQKRKV